MEKFDNIRLPDYNHCILNTITSILKYYDVDTAYNSLDSLDKFLNQEYKNIVFIVLDGMGNEILNKVSPNGYFVNNRVDCVTSVYPSTTAAAMTSYYTGKSPLETGWLAWRQYFKEYGRSFEMFKGREVDFGYDLGLFNKSDLFDSLMDYETIFDKIDKNFNGIKTYEISPSYSKKRASRSIRAENLDEAILILEDICRLPDKKFVFVYVDNPDTLMHNYGSTSNEARNCIISAEDKIKDMCENNLDNTLTIISADHGHKDIENYYSILDYPKINDCLIMPATLESRFLNFYVKEDRKKEFEKCFNELFGEEFWLMTKKEFFEKHFLGYGVEHKKIDDFIGNYVALAVKGSVIKPENYFTRKGNKKISTHCGLTREEMEVPVIVINK